MEEGARESVVSPFYPGDCEGVLFTHEVVSALLVLASKAAIVDIVAVEALMSTAVVVIIVVVVVVSHIQRFGCHAEKTNSHGSQSRSWSAEQGKENKRTKEKVWQCSPPPPRCSFGENKDVNHATYLHA